MKYVYQYKDHLGNVRLSYADTNNNGSITQSEIIEESNYYPFGLKHKGYNNVVSSNGNSVAQRWKFSGKELNDELGLNWYDISARNYDASLGRWMNLDPLAEEMRRHSPYNYAFNNPVYWFDPDGMKPQDDYFNKKGEYLGSDNTKTDNIRVIDQKTWNDNKTVNKDGGESIDAGTGVKNSKVVSKSDLTDEASLKIYEHYNPTDLNIEVDNKMGANAVFSRTITKKGGKVTSVKAKMRVNVEKNKKLKISDHANEIKSVLVHEQQHYEDYKKLGNNSFSKLTSTQKERSAYSAQIKHPTFKKTRPGFQKAVRNSSVKYGGIISNGLMSKPLKLN